jgi:hypothetical protein
MEPSSDFLAAAAGNGVKAIKKSRYHPNSNGQVKQVHSPVKKLLEFLCNQRPVELLPV